MMAVLYTSICLWFVIRSASNPHIHKSETSQANQIEQGAENNRYERRAFLRRRRTSTWFDFTERTQFASETDETRP
jgi:hypothetical protein